MTPKRIYSDSNYIIHHNYVVEKHNLGSLECLLGMANTIDNEWLLGVSYDGLLNPNWRSFPKNSYSER